MVAAAFGAAGMSVEDTERPQEIIIVRRGGGDEEDGHHGGAWGRSPSPTS